MLRILLHKVYGRLSYSLYEERAGEGREGKDSMASMLGSAGQVRESDLEELRRRPELYFVKTHGHPLDDSPALCLIRDGRDALVSYAHFVRAHERDMARRYSFDDVLRILIESREHFGGWSGNVRSWHGRTRQGPTVWLRYEDLLRDPVGRLEEAMVQLGVELHPTGAAPVAFGELRRRWPEFFRIGRPGAWLREMSEEMHELFWRHHHAPMQWFGYERPGR